MNNLKVRLILLSALAAGETYKPEHILYDKERAVKSTYPIGNFMGAVITVNWQGKRQDVRFVPDSDYSNPHNPNQPYVILKQNSDGGWDKYYYDPGSEAMLKHLFPHDYPTEEVESEVSYEVKRVTLADLNISYLMSKARHSIGAVSNNDPCVARCYV